MEAQLVAKFLEEYASSEMDEALRALRQFLDKRGGAEGVMQFVGEGRTLYPTTNAARRTVHYYFKKAYRLYEHGLLSKEALRLVVGVNGYDLLYEVVRPLSESVAPPGSDPTRGEWFDRLRKVCPPQEND